MLPRRSIVLRYATIAAFSAVALLLWVTGPGGGDSVSVWLRMLHGPLNETEVKVEFVRLQYELNVTYPYVNKTVEELYQYVQLMRSQIPVNPHKFQYIINPTKICAHEDIFLLTYVHSAPAHHKRRMAIRETWGHPKNFPEFIHRVVFLMGKSKEHALQEALQMESDMYGDIIQEDFIDSYRNLTYKAIEGLKWISHHCAHARFILKTDDDIFVNIFTLVAHLRSIFKQTDGVSAPSQLLLCLVWYHMKVVREPKSKWYIPYAEFREDFFPTYCSGSAFVLSADVVKDMYNASLHTPFFWVDDFYVTGLLAKKVGVVHRKFNSVYVLGPSVFLDRFTEENKWRTLVFGHVHNLNHVFHVWKAVLRDRQLGGQRPMMEHIGS